MEESLGKKTGTANEEETTGSESLLGNVFESSPLTTVENSRNSFSPSPVRNAEIFDMALNGSDYNPRRRVVYSSEEDITPPPEPTTTCLGQWKVRPVEVDKYVNDNLEEEAVNFENAQKILTNGKEHRVKQAVATQNVFRHIVRRVKRKGMKVNTKKTNMVCISDSLNHSTETYILDKDNTRVGSVERMRVLGWHFSSRPTAKAQIGILKKRFRERLWILHHLRHNGFTEQELVVVYTTMVRPVADFMQEVYHSMITDAQDEALECLQVLALRAIFRLRLYGRKLRGLANVTTLRDRRIAQVDKFAKKCAASDRFSDWFPRNEAKRTRNSEEYFEEYARCDRLKNSPVFYMRRRLNGKQGRTYGERNRQYREEITR